MLLLGADRPVEGFGHCGPETWIIDGKVSFDEGKLAQNIRAFVDAVSKAKPSGAKGTYVKKVSLSSTMGPGVAIDQATLGV